MKKFIIVLSVLFLSACSSQFAYNNLDWLVHWYLDDYIDLEAPQKDAFDVQFAGWHSWHRTEELAKYEAHLKDVRAMLENGEFDANDVREQFKRGREHWQRFRAHVAPNVAELAVLLNDEQITELFDSLEEKNAEEEEERLEMSSEDIHEEFKEIFAEQLEDYFGKLTSTQKQMVNQKVTEIIPNRLEWIKYRRNVQKAAKEMMLARKDNPNFQQDFVALMNNPDTFQHPLYIQNNEQNRQVFAQMVVEAYKTLTPKQKRRIYRKIDNFIEDFSELRERGS